MSCLSIEIEPDQHRQIKTLATYEGMTIKDFILSRTLAPRKSSKEEDTTDKLLSHPKNRARLLESIKVPEKSHIVFETLEELEDALEI